MFLTNLEELYNDAEKAAQELILTSFEDSKVEELVDKLIRERKFLIDEIQYQKQRGHYYQTEDFILQVDNMNSEAINNMFLLSNKLNVSKGKLVNSLLKAYNIDHLPTVADLSDLLMNKNIFSISHLNTLTVNSADLEGISKYSLNHIKQLYIEDDVTEDLFKKKILQISHCKFVSLPNHIPKLLILAKLSFVDTIEIR